jgi:hypothetical protein
MDWLTYAELKLELPSSQTHAILEKNLKQSILPSVLNGLLSLYRKYYEIPAFIKHFWLNEVQDTLVEIVQNSTLTIRTHV